MSNRNYSIKKIAQYILLLDKFDEYGYERSMKESACVDEDGNPIPWFTYPAIEYLKQFDFSEKRIFEFGSGSSSLFFGARAKELITVEHDKKWHENCCAYAKDNVTIHLRECQETDTFESLPPYVECLLDQKGLFDVIIIDGLFRKECAMIAAQKLTKTGCIIFDDSERASDLEDYAEGIAALKSASLIQVDFYGFAPLIWYTKSTSMFLSPQFDFKTKSGFQPEKGIGNISAKE